MTELPPLSVYVHLPWCAKKCPYCDFNSHAAAGALPEADYLTALRRDLNNDLALVQGRQISSIFIGGGTPSLFSVTGIAAVLDLLHQELNVNDDAEITLEANPGTIERGKFAGFKAAGINRVSLGVQSFNDSHLQILGRIHNAAEAGTAIEEVIAAGFDKWNIDLMHGLPAQSSDDAIADLQRALAYGAAHISWYQLTIEPNTRFYSQPPTLPDEATLAAIDERGRQLLLDSGFQQYEISAWSQPAAVSEHNLNYWQFGDYLGLGAGAHAKISTPEIISRYWKVRQPDAYMQAAGTMLAGERTLGQAELPFEFLMNALRLNAGFQIDLFEQRTGLPLQNIEQQLDSLIKQELLANKDGRIHTTLLGRRFLNDLLENFI